MSALLNDPVAASIREKHKAKQEARSEKVASFKERVAEGEVTLIAERNPVGLYTVKFDGGGAIPEELKGKWNSVAKLRKMVVNRYGKDILVCQ